MPGNDFGCRAFLSSSEVQAGCNALPRDQFSVRLELPLDTERKDACANCYTRDTLQRRLELVSNAALSSHEHAALNAFDTQIIADSCTLTLLNNVANTTAVNTRVELGLSTRRGKVIYTIEKLDLSHFSPL